MFIICSKCKNEDVKIFKEKELIEILKILRLIENSTKMQKNIDQTRDYLLAVKQQNKLIRRKHKRFCTFLNYIEHFLILASTITGCTSISAFLFLLNIRIGITRSAIGLKICAIVAGVKRYNSIKSGISQKNPDKIILLAISKLNS